MALIPDDLRQVFCLHLRFFTEVHQDSNIFNVHNATDKKFQFLSLTALSTVAT